MNSEDTSKNYRAESMPRDCNEKEELSLTDAVQILDDINRRIKDAENLLDEQRVNSTILALELATLHDPLMRETLATCTQANAQAIQEIDECKKTLDQISQAIHSSTFQEGHCKPQEIQGLRPEGLQSPLSNSSQMKTTVDQNHTFQSQGSQPPLMLDSNGIQADFDKHHSNIQVKGAPPNSPIILDGPSDDISDHASQGGTKLLHQDYNPASNGVIESSARASVDTEMIDVSSDSHSHHYDYIVQETSTVVQSYLDTHTSESVFNSVPGTESMEQTDSNDCDNSGRK